VRYGQLNQLHAEDVQEPVRTAVGHGQGTHYTGTRFAREVSRDCVLVAGENNAVIAV